MNRRTQLYVAFVAGFALVLLIASLLRWENRDPIRFIGFLTVALLASTFKVRIPGLEGTYSMNFPVLLAAVYELNAGELLGIALGCGVAQSYWRAARRPAIIQVVFNSSNLVISVVGAYGLLHLLQFLTVDWLFLSGAVAAFGFYLINTGLTSFVLYLVHGAGFEGVWERWNVYVLPYYLLGSTLSTAWIFCTRQVHWQGVPLVLFLLYLVFRLLRVFVSTQPARDSVASHGG